MGNEQDAKQYIQQAKRGNAEAQYQLAECYRNGYGTKVNGKKAFKWYKKSAKQGHAKAEFRFGLCFLGGAGTQVNVEKGIEWLTRSAEQEEADAENVLAMCYFTGQGVSVDFSKTLFWYEKAYSHGKRDLAEKIGMMYYDRIYNLQNQTKAIPYLEEGAEQGDCGAMWRLAEYYSNDLHQDLDKAEKYIREARAHMTSEDDDTKGTIERLFGMILLAEKSKKHSEDDESWDDNYDEIALAFQRAADYGDIHSMYLLGKMYFEGTLVKGNKNAAMKWYEKAADEGIPDAQVQCAKVYFYGDEEIPGDDEKAFHYAKLAAENGDADAQDMLGRCYYAGKGVSPNPYLAEKWLTKAAKQECVSAHYFLGKLLEDQNRYSEAYAWFQKFVDRGEEIKKEYLEEVKVEMEVCRRMANIRN